jgi:hypothetical protein
MEESANSSVPPGHDTEHHRATFEGGPAPSAQEAIESLLESSLSLQRDTQDAPDGTTSDSLHEPSHSSTVYSKSREPQEK